MKDNHNNSIDERCLPSADAHCEPSDPWGGAIDQRFTSIPKDDDYHPKRFRAGTTPEDDDYEPRRSLMGPESSPCQDSIPKGAYYNEYGFLVFPSTSDYIPIVPEEVEDFWP